MWCSAQTVGHDGISGRPLGIGFADGEVIWGFAFGGGPRAFVGVAPFGAHACLGHDVGVAAQVAQLISSFGDEDDIIGRTHLGATPFRCCPGPIPWRWGCPPILSISRYRQESPCWTPWFFMKRSCDLSTQVCGAWDVQVPLDLEVYFS